jgi:hypothetical protein
MYFNFVQVECLSFNFSMKGEGGLRSLSIIQKDEDQEETGGQVLVLWQMDVADLDNDGWQMGMVPVRAHTVDDVLQNYTVSEAGCVAL